MKPTEKEIEYAKWKSREKNCISDNFLNGFEDGVKWLLNWQKTQPLTVYYVMVGENEIVDVCRTEESASKSISDLLKSYPTTEFYIDERIIN